MSEPADKACPICGSARSAEHAPFCSVRCQQIDLHRWLGGVYTIPSDETADDAARPPDQDD